MQLVYLLNFVGLCAYAFWLLQSGPGLGDREEVFHPSSPRAWLEPEE